MKKLTIVILFFCVVSVTAANISTRVCLADANTPFIDRDIMVGTRLTIIVSSDANEDYLPCDLGIKESDGAYGILSDPNLLESAGDGAMLYASVWPSTTEQVEGFSYSGGGYIGDWFKVDYIATAVGDCNVGFYEWFAMEPTYEISFSHVRTRDFDGSTIVDLADFRVLASNWQSTGCIDPNWCDGTDLDASTVVDANDLILFGEYWLEKTE